MPTFKFEAMDTTGGEVKDAIDAVNEEEAQQTIRQMGYFVTKITERAKGQEEGDGTAKKAAAARRRSRSPSAASRPSSSAPSPASSRRCRTPACPILRSLKILEGQCKPGVLKNALDRRRRRHRERQRRSPRRWPSTPRPSTGCTCNMVKAGEAGGALEVILQRLAEFKEKAQTPQAADQGAMIYPIVVIFVAVRHLDVHHDLHHPEVREDLRGLRPRRCRR